MNIHFLLCKCNFTVSNIRWAIIPFLPLAWKASAALVPVIYIVSDVISNGIYSNFCNVINCHHHIFCYFISPIYFDKQLTSFDCKVACL